MILFTTCRAPIATFNVLFNDWPLTKVQIRFGAMVVQKYFVLGPKLNPPTINFSSLDLEIFVIHTRKH